MVNRFLAGYNPLFGDHGVFLTVPNIDVFSTTFEPHFIVASAFKSVQLVAAGIQYVPGSSGNSYYFPEPLPNAPHVEFVLNLDLGRPHVAVPWDPQDTTYSDFYGVIDVYNTRIDFWNPNGSAGCYFYWCAWQRNRFA